MFERRDDHGRSDTIQIVVVPGRTQVRRIVSYNAGRSTSSRSTDFGRVPREGESLGIPGNYSFRFAGDAKGRPRGPGLAR